MATTTEQAQRFFANMGSVMQQLATTADNLRNLHGAAQARGWDAWTDADLLEAGYTRDDLLTLLYLADNFDQFLSNGTPAQADRWPAIQKFRTDI